MSRAYTKDEVPEPVWEFAQWVIKRYHAKYRRRGRLTLDQWLEVSAEARRRGLTVTESPEGRFLNIDYVKQ